MLVGYLDIKKLIKKIRGLEPRESFTLRRYVVNRGERSVVKISKEYRVIIEVTSGACVNT